MARRLLIAALAAGVMSTALGAAGSAAAQRGPGSPMRIVLLVDSSNAVGSMINPFRSALNAFLETLPGDPEIVLVTTGGQLRVREGPTMDREKLRAAANRFAPDGGGNTFVDTLLEADKRFLQSAPELRSIVVILSTDLDSQAAVRTDRYNAFMRDFVGRGGRAHAVIVNSLNGGMTSQIAMNLANNTGGYYQSVTIATALPKLMQAIADHVAADQ